ncbi:MAG: hypothetical protein V7L04_23620 [Nostoc sp.]|uniref:hypothetical protein n=1 Tax=Nostoc sp. TaxID=1180 RepID=UPI002FFA991D
MSKSRSGNIIHSAERSSVFSIFNAQYPMPNAQCPNCILLCHQKYLDQPKQLLLAG